MINDKIFKNYINLFSPYSNEYIHDYAQILGYKNNDLKDLKVKLDILNAIKYLFELDVIYIYSWGNQKPLDIKDISTKDIINHIDSYWVLGAKYPDFYTMAMFGYKKWYVEKLEKLGMTYTTNWETFVREKIGDLEKWINQNKPKE